MVIIQLFGGLGNQMFQYAAARRLAQERSSIPKLDVTAFENYTLRQYKLSHFKIQQNFASREELLPFKSRAFRLRLPRALDKFSLPYYRRRIFYEKHPFRYDANILRVRQFVLLSGYFQSEEYFRPISDLIRQEFVLADPPTPNSQKLASEIEAANSVSIHIRRGDYVTSDETRAFHGLLPLTYYQASVRAVEQTVANPVFFVFSDDPEWARANIKLKYPTRFMEANGEERDYEDLWLLSLCKHHIIANSSFSWWGAWLSRNPRKQVYAPRRWINADDLDSTDFSPREWIQL